MIPRGPLIVALIVVEIAILGGMVRAVSGGPSFPAMTVTLPMAPAAPAAPAGPFVATRDAFVESGPHKFFAAGPHPALYVDIGYADLTILAGSTAQIDASVSKSTDFGPLRATAPITGRQSGDTVRIETRQSDGFSIGDNRMVTVLVPPGTSVNVLRAGDIRVTGMRGDASIKSVGNGHVTIDDYNAPTLRLETSNGDISLNGVITGNLNVTTSNGSIDGTELQVRDGSVVTSNDSIRLGFAAGTNTVVTAETSNGSVHLFGFPAGTQAATHRSSDDDDDDDGASQTVRIGAGTGRLDVQASNGNIDLSQAG
jgi:hypothetical protein